MNKVIKLGMIVLCLTGCVTKRTVEINVDETYNSMTNSPIRAVVVGLTSVDPKFYGGWAGACPGCDVDANKMEALLKSKNIPLFKLLNADATKNKVVSACTLASQGIKSNDTLIVFVSGHGGQVADTNNDEEDKLDETLCLYDGQFSDDIVWSLLCQLPVGVKVVMITDSCNSGTNYRSMHTYSRPWYRMAGLKASLLHFGGCGDGQSSFGNVTGGMFTTSLIKVYNDNLTYEEWFNRAKAITPPSQIPTIREENQSFKSNKVFN